MKRKHCKNCITCCFIFLENQIIHVCLNITCQCFYVFRPTTKNTCVSYYMEFQNRYFFLSFFFEIFLCNIIIFFYYYLLIKVLGSVNLGISGRVGRVTGNTYFFGLINIYLFEAYAL